MIYCVPGDVIIGLSRAVGIASHQTASGPKNIILKKLVVIFENFCYLDLFEGFQVWLTPRGI